MNIKEISKYSLKNKTMLKNSKQCACYFCLSLFEFKDIENWIDCGETALCPKCGIDSVVGDFSMDLDPDLLKEASSYWFY